MEKSMATINKWGNSAGLRLPQSILEAAGLNFGSTVSIRLLDNGSILLTPRMKKLAVIDGESITQVVPKPVAKPVVW
jgi:antitoxin component of MazEF toxin-antitoxin module